MELSDEIMAFYLLRIAAIRSSSSATRREETNISSAMLISGEFIPGCEPMLRDPFGVASWMEYLYRMAVIRIQALSGN